MIHFLMAAMTLNGTLLGLLYLGRHRLLRLPMPGLWLLAFILLDILLTLGVAEVTLP